MVIKKEDDFDEEEKDSESQDEKKGFSIGISTIITGILFLILVETFLYFLSTKTDAEFGVEKIIFGIIISTAIISFFIWVKYIIQINKHLGTIIGITGTVASVYGLTRQFKGPYTTTFTIIGTVIALGYVLMQFIKSKK
ncbi:hypothetical protein EXS72_00855 [Candidatus Pacearchaeota archaeon]|nr:hypothetical protein [Candidatus Pacearchaeota archaeon]